MNYTATFDAGTYRLLGSPKIDREDNRADRLSFSIPAEKSDFLLISINDVVTVYRDSDGTQVFRGYVNERRWEESFISIEAETDETLLNRFILPNQFGYALRIGYPLVQDYVTALAENNFGVTRVKDFEQWDAEIVTNSNMEIGTDYIAAVYDEGLETYAASANVVVRFTLASVEDPDAARWDRIRWVGTFDLDDINYTTVEYRTGATVGTLGAWSTPTQGAMVDTLGIEIDSTDNILDVRLSVINNDTSQTGLFTVLEAIHTSPTGIVAGTFSDDSDITVVPNLRVDGGTNLAAIRDVCEETGFKFRVREGVIDVVENFGADRSSTVVLRSE